MTLFCKSPSIFFMLIDSSPEKVILIFEGNDFCSSATRSLTWLTVSTIFAPILFEISRVKADLSLSLANFSGSLKVLFREAISLNFIVFLSLTLIGVLKISFRFSYKPGILITKRPSPVSKFPAETT